jgi:glutaredoxin-related protein
VHEVKELPNGHIVVNNCSKNQMVGGCDIVTFDEQSYGQQRKCNLNTRNMEGIQQSLSPVEGNYLVGGCDIVTFDEESYGQQSKCNLNTRKHGRNSAKP